MPRGKTSESEALKKTFSAYLSLSDEDQVIFRNKTFAKLCSRVSKETRGALKMKREALLEEIENAEQHDKLIADAEKLSAAELEAIVAKKRATESK